MNEDLSECIDQICSFPINYKNGSLSPVNILKMCGYFKLFASVTTDLISNYLTKNRSIINSWVLYTEDIRHFPAWGFGLEDDKWFVTYFDGDKIIQEFIFNNDIEACAKMIKMTSEQIRINNL